MKNIIFVLFVLAIGCSPCKYVAKHPECFRPDTVKQIERVVHTEKEYILKDSIHYDTLPGDVIKETVYQTKWRVKTDTIYRYEKTDRTNPINEQLKQDNQDLQIENGVLKSQRNKLAFGLSGLLILMILYFLVRRFLF